MNKKTKVHDVVGDVRKKVKQVRPRTAQVLAAAACVCVVGALSLSSGPAHALPCRTYFRDVLNRLALVMRSSSLLELGRREPQTSHVLHIP